MLSGHRVQHQGFCLRSAITPSTATIVYFRLHEIIPQLALEHDHVSPYVAECRCFLFLERQWFEQMSQALTSQRRCQGAVVVSTWEKCGVSEARRGDGWTSSPLPDLLGNSTEAPLPSKRCGDVFTPTWGGFSKNNRRRTSPLLRSFWEKEGRTSMSFPFHRQGKSDHSQARGATTTPFNISPVTPLSLHQKSRNKEAPPQRSNSHFPRGGGGNPKPTIAAEKPLAACRPLCRNDADKDECVRMGGPSVAWSGGWRFQTAFPHACR